MVSNICKPCMSLTVVVDVLVVEMWVGRVDTVQRKRKTSFGRVHGLYSDFVHSQVHDRGQRKAIVGLRHPDHLFHPVREKRTVKKTTCPSVKDGLSFKRPPDACRARERKHRVRPVGVAKWIREKSLPDRNLTVPFGRSVHWIGVIDVTFSQEGNSKCLGNGDAYDRDKTNGTTRSDRGPTKAVTVRLFGRRCQKFTVTFRALAVRPREGTADNGPCVVSGHY